MNVAIAITDETVRITIEHAYSKRRDTPRKLKGTSLASGSQIGSIYPSNVVADFDPVPLPELEFSPSIFPDEEFVIDDSEPLTSIDWDELLDGWDENLYV